MKKLMFLFGVVFMVILWSCDKKQEEVEEIGVLKSIESIPSAPTNVSATDGTYAEKIVITWTASAGATYYQLYQDGIRIRSSISSSPYNETEYFACSDAPSEYALKACNGEGCSALSTGDNGYIKIPNKPNNPTGEGHPCIESSLTYTTSAVTGATDYIWEAVGDGATCISGCTTTSATWHFDSENAVSLRVWANNDCGASTTFGYRNVDVQSTYPPTAGEISGTTTPVCDKANTYSIDALEDASSYIWAYSGTKTYLINEGTSCSLNPTSSGIIQVKGVNGCGNSVNWQLLSLTGSAPAVPDTPSGDTYISGGDAGKRTYYTIPAVSGATSYTWDKSGSGYPYNPPYYNWWTGTTSASLYYYGANDGGVAIWVKSNNSCGSSANSSVLNVSIHSY